jgi:hypothetical protein
MDGRADLATMEREAYRAYWSDGSVDLYIGLSMLFMGVMWTWVNDFSGLAGILPAIFVTPMLAWRKRFVEARLGHVRWRPARREWEHRNLLMLLVAGVGLLLLGVAVNAAVGPNGGGSLHLAPGLLAWLLVLLAIGLAFLLDARQMLLYAVVLLLSGVVVVLLQAEPGWPMLVTGAVATVVGLAMMRRFVRRYPVIEEA